VSRPKPLRGRFASLDTADSSSRALHLMAFLRHA
jgi:hypothetical protein